MKQLLRPLGALFVCLIAARVSAQNFYEAHFLSGVEDYNRGTYARAVDELRIAAFGRVDDVARYEVAEIYLTLASDKLDQVEDARVTALKVIQAEQTKPVYATLDLPREVRAAFEALLPTILTREQLSHSGAFQRLASQAPLVQSGAPRLSRKPTPQVPTPTKRSPVAVTVEKNDDKVETPQALDYGRMALEHVAAGDEAGGQHYAELALGLDDTNVNAHTALAQIARAHGNWNGVAEHYAVVRTHRKLTDDEAADYFIALVKTSRTADALGVRKGLPPSVLARNDVRQALQSIEPDAVPQRPVPQPPAPQPPRQPVPQPREQPQQPAPQPRAQPQQPEPQPRVQPQPAQQPPTPQPVAPQPTPRQPAPQPQVSQPVPQSVAPQPSIPRQPAPQPQTAPRTTQPAAPQPQLSTPAPAPSVSETPAPPVAAQIAAAEHLLGQNDIVGARTELRRISALPDLQRSDRLALGRAMSQSGLYAESSAQYRKTYPLKAGEEPHMFYEAVNRYQLGDYDLARQLMTRAAPALPQTPAVLAYRDRILAQQ